VDHHGSLGKPSLTCGLCGAVILLPNGDMLRCESCGQPIADAADGVKLCDGKIVHSICGTRTH
jgi:ribosomal protein S27E